jgi:hypothetical protein
MTGARNHAADDGSLARSTGGAAARGALLIALAVVIGLVLMAFALEDESTEVTSTDDTDQPTETTVPDEGNDGTGTDVGDPDDTDNGATGTTAAPATIPPADGGDPRPPGEVNVLVSNGTGGKGVAGEVSDKLIARGYISPSSNAPSTAESVIYYRDTYEDDARAVAQIIGTTADLLRPAADPIAVSPAAINDGRLDAANIVVIIGNDERIPFS